MPISTSTLNGRDLVLEIISRHASSLLATARRYSLCADDAQDAYQRALEIFLRRAGDVRPDTAPAWLRAVIKHEALAVRAARLRLVGPAEADLDTHEARELDSAEERACDFERARRSAEALGSLKPAEVRALVLKAHGYSYHEICRITGWSYTKVNRCLTEGRRSLRDRLADIESGRECERWAGVLSALADGEARPDEVVAVRPHLRACAACRANLREYRGASRSVAAVVPLLALVEPPAVAHETPSLALRLYEAISGSAAGSAQKLQAGLEAASSGKLAAVAASATALAGSGMAVVQRGMERTAIARTERTALERRHDDRRERRHRRPDPEGRGDRPIAQAHQGHRGGEDPAEPEPAARDDEPEFTPEASWHEEVDAGSPATEPPVAVAATPEPVSDSSEFGP